MKAPKELGCGQGVDQSKNRVVNEEPSVEVQETWARGDKTLCCYVLYSESLQAI